MKNIFLICLLTLISGCSSISSPKKVTNILDVNLNFTICTNSFETLSGERITKQKTLRPGLTFYEVYTCRSQKPENVYITRTNPFFITKEIIVIENGERIKPYYNFSNTGDVNIFFEIKKYADVTIKIKNVVVAVSNVSL